MRSLTAAVAAALVLLPAAPAWAAGQPPVAVDDAVNIRSAAGVDFLVGALANDSDPDGDPLSYTSVTPATKGITSIQSGRLFYRPILGNSGPDSFTYTVSDGQGNTATATVAVTLWADLPAPVGLGLSGGSLTSATLTWPAATDAVAYQVFRNSLLVATTSGLSWTDNGLLGERYYEYRIAGVNGGGFGGAAQSSPAYRYPQEPAPTDLTVSVTGDPTALSVTWSNGAYGPWNVYRDGTLLASSTTRAFTDTGLVTGREYSYQVQSAGSTSPIYMSPPSGLTAAVRGTPGLTPITQLVRDRNLTGTLGPVTVPERAIPGGRQQDHQNGLVLQRTGAEPFVVGHSGFPAAYTRAGGPTGELGFPLGDVECADPRAQGCIQLFEGGSIVRSSASWATVVVRQVIEDGWAASGWEDGPLGWPVNDQRATARGVSQLFEGGHVTWSPATGSHGVSGQSGFWTVWGRGGYETGRLGYPVTGEFCGLRNDGCFQEFEGGAIYSSRDNGVHAVFTPYLDTWAAHGWEDGRLGYPVGGEICGLPRGGCLQTFEGGYIHWSPASGMHAVFTPYAQVWGRYGGESGRMGYPVGGEICGLPRGGCLQTFQGGYIHWSPASGMHAVFTPYAQVWGRYGGESGRMGYPIAGEVCGLSGGGCFQQFQDGAIYWSPASGMHAVFGGIRETWARQGWERGRLGYPVSGESFSGGAFRQTFQGGTITITSAGPRITYR